VESQKTALFICHASEDKTGFVRPLAEALKPHFKVWYDEYELHVGDSLLRKINEGLISSDYGVVVLSQAFFHKKWPQSELDGLFALETETRKMILPVWKGVTEDDVKGFSPILAGRLAANAADGVPRIVSDLRKSIEASSRQREIITSNPAIVHGLRVDHKLREKLEAERLSNCEEGVELVKDSLKLIHNEMELLLVEFNQSSTILKIRSECLPAQYPTIQISSNQHISLTATLYGLGINFCDHAALGVVVYDRHKKSYGLEGNRQEMKFNPKFFLPKKVGWFDSRVQRALSASEMAHFFFAVVTTEIEVE
jgi:TIR domain